MNPASRKTHIAGSVLIGIGANLSHPVYGAALETCKAALDQLENADVRVAARSRFFRSAPVPMSDQPWFINAVAEIKTSLDPQSLLAVLHEIEERFGRVRHKKNEARVLDLDLLTYGDITSEETSGLTLPHPRLHERAFVLLPIRDLNAQWRHPVDGRSIDALIAQLAQDQAIEPLDG